MGGTVSAQAPDPRLEAAQIESMRGQLDIGRKSAALAEEMRPAQMEQMRFGLDASKTAYEQTQQDRQYALAKRDAYDKALGGVLNETEKFDEAARRNELGQQAAADVSKAYSQAGEQGRRAMTRGSFNPISGKAIMADQAVELDEARARAEASRMVGEAAKQEGLNLKKGAVGMLAGYPAMASQLSPTSARLGWGALDAANSGVGGMMAGYTTGSNLMGAAGENASGMYKTQADLWSQAQRANENTKQEIYGAAAGAASRYGAGKLGEYMDARKASAAGAGTVSSDVGLKFG
jgi:hypothetical protein